MNNNDLFIDTMDKINTIAKSKGFVNGMDFARLAKGTNEITEIAFSSFEGCHSLRNLMAHGFAKDIVISPETLSDVMSFLSAVAQTKLTSEDKENAENANDITRPQEGDFVLIPFFDFFFYENEPEKEYDSYCKYKRPNDNRYLWKAPEITGIITRLKKTRVKSEDNRNSIEICAACNHMGYPELDLWHVSTNFIVFKSIPELTMMCNRPLYTTSFSLENGILKFNVATMSKAGYKELNNNVLTIRNEFTCPAKVVSNQIAITPSIRTSLINYASQGVKDLHWKTKENMAISIPPSPGNPYYNDYAKWLEKRKNAWGAHCSWWERSLMPPGQIDYSSVNNNDDDDLPY